MEATKKITSGIAWEHGESRKFNQEPQKKSTKNGQAGKTSLGAQRYNTVLQRLAGSVVLLRLGIVSRSSRQAARTDNELGQETAHTPPVHRHAMTLPVAQEELGRHVLQCADI